MSLEISEPQKDHMEVEMKTYLRNQLWISASQTQKIRLLLLNMFKIYILIIEGRRMWSDMLLDYLDTGCNGVVFVQMRKRDEDPTPKKIAHRMISTAAATRKHMSRFILRVLPIEATCYYSSEEISRAIKPLIAQYFPVEVETPYKSEELAEVRQMRNTPDFFNKLVDSVAPTVFGHQDIKRAILLMLLGGVHKFTHEGINLRGDINVCIVGDPSCAKSQFLKHTTTLVSRSVYTSGKSSSAAGLTATVAKEPETGEFCIEAGALMLADNGVCCIDEFDKMDVRDQVAIHEAMEQQTISITKAGIQATLNARTSILAAANPTGGRYDKSKPLKYNVALPPAILSRFDLVYVMIDDPDDTTDFHIASHIVRVHQKREEAVSPTFTTAQLKRYIAVAKSKKPKLNAEARQILVDSYVALRKGDTAPGSRVAYRMTVRQLEALIRLSEAIARCHLDDEVHPRHVRLATRLLKTSVISVESTEIDLTEFQDDIQEENQEGVDIGGNGEAQPSGADADMTNEHPENAEVPGAKKLVITDEYFQRVTQALLMRLRQHEETVAREGTGLAGMRQRDLIQWYVGQQNEKNNYNSMEEAKAEVTKIKAIIESLVRREGHLIVVDEEEAAAQGDDDGNGRRTSRNNRILAVAPNYVID